MEGAGSVVERFDSYMERCLYGPEGFYSTTGSAGRRGDFITSPEVGPLFGAVLARTVTQWWNEAGCPADFTVVDVGCGPGTLLRALKQATGDGHRWRFLGVDRAPDQSTGQSLAKAGIELAAELPDDLTRSVVIGNEILDNMPTRVIVAGPRPDEYQEVFVESSDGLVTELLQPIGPDGSDNPDATFAATVIEPLIEPLRGAVQDAGVRLPVHGQASDWVARVVEREPVALCLFDYGAPTTVELAERGGWLRTYRDHGRGDDPYLEPGGWDITTDVGFDQLPTPTWLGRQREFLAAWGIDELVAAGSAYWADHAHAPDLAAIRMRSRVTEAPALLDPDGLGDWMVAVWSSGEIDAVPPAGSTAGQWRS